MSFQQKIPPPTGTKKSSWFRTSSLTGRMLLTGLPLLTAILLLLFVFAGKSIQNLLDHAISRNAQLQAQALSAQLEHILGETRNQLLLLAAGPLDKKDMLERLRMHQETSSPFPREVAFMGVDPEDRYLLVNYHDEIIEVPAPSARDVAAGPFQASSHNEEKGAVSVSRPFEVAYPLVPVGGQPQTISFPGLRFSTPIYEDKIFKGILSVSLDLTELRNRLSQAEGGANAGHSFFFDRDGWILFQSELDNSPGRPMGFDGARTGFSGDFGRTGFSHAFRPAPEHLNYWTMVKEIQGGTSGLLALPAMASALKADKNLSGAVSFAPVSIAAAPGSPPVVVGGVGTLDPEFIAGNPDGKILAIFSICLAGGILLFGLGLCQIAHSVSKKLNLMAAEIQSRNRAGSAEPLDMPPMPRELERLRAGVDALLGRLRDKKISLASQSRARDAQWRAEPVSVLAPVKRLTPHAIVGQSQPMLRLNAQIHKAAQADCDILITGETGTGKELVSESIHRLSSRNTGPFISINCGALDESLLMDTLFGHVRGAFTEAREPRKGAFLAACQGTLLLDEIGNASPKVQQALLRAISTRHIRPLGSDEDVPFDTRIIAATNSPLSGSDQDFRSDLYYRLAVITIETPPLRQRLEDISDLAQHFIQLSRPHDSSPPDLSRGALEKLLTYSWPGNVRELKNVVIRAITFCNGSMIYAQDLTLGRPDDTLDEDAAAVEPESGPEIIVPGPSAVQAETLPPQNSEDAGGSAPDALTGRLRRVWPLLAGRESVSRQEYQQLAGEDISARTAQYDLSLLVRLGFMRREGKGPSMRYLPVKTARLQK